jgi:hypothetical protein
MNPKIELLPLAKINSKNRSSRQAWQHSKDSGRRISTLRPAWATTRCLQKKKKTNKTSQIIDPNVKFRIIKLLENNMGENIWMFFGMVVTFQV